MKNRLIKSLAVSLLLLGLSSANANDEKMLEPVPFSQVKPFIADKKPMMIEFGATSCRSCIVMGKLLYKVKQKHPHSNIFFINIYEDKQAAKEYKIRMIPTQVYLDADGKEIDRHIGKISEDELYDKLKKMNIIVDSK